MSEPENPSAFPQAHVVQKRFQPTGQPMDDLIGIGQPGMTLRDWFAGQAMSSQAMSVNRFYVPVDVAHQAYLLADAMLAERKKGSHE